MADRCQFATTARMPLLRQYASGTLTHLIPSEACQMKRSDQSIHRPGVPRQHYGLKNVLFYAEKLQCICDITKYFCAAKNMKKKQLPSFLSHLKFVMCICPQGRSIIPQLLDKASSMPNLHNLTFLDKEHHSDLHICSPLLNHWNINTFIYDEGISLIH